MEESATIYRFCAWIAPLGLREHILVDGGMMLSRTTEERKRKRAVKKLLSVTKENAVSKLFG
jgi:hypothetical protein